MLRLYYRRLPLEILAHIHGNSSVTVHPSGACTLRKIPSDIHVVIGVILADSLEVDICKESDASHFCGELHSRAVAESIREIAPVV